MSIKYEVSISKWAVTDTERFETDDGEYFVEIFTQWKWMAPITINVDEELSDEEIQKIKSDISYIYELDKNADYLSGEDAGSRHILDTNYPDLEECDDEDAWDFWEDELEGTVFSPVDDTREIAEDAEVTVERV